MSTDGLRIGHGFDVHRFSEEFDKAKPLVLAGVTLPEQRSLVAHSDGDLILHAVCDAILGAIAAGDIGQHFPDDDPSFKGIASTELLKEVLGLVQGRNCKLVNLDVTVVAQVPRLSGYMQELKANLASLLQLNPDRVNIKATTTEGMGFIGREEGMACHAVILMRANA